MIPPKRFDIFPPDWRGCSEGLDAFRFFLKQLLVVGSPTSSLLELYTWAVSESTCEVS